MNDRAAQPAPSSPRGRLLRNPLLHAALIVLVGVAAYANTFHAAFQLDDYRRMLDLPYVRDLRYLTDPSVFRQYAAMHDFRLRFVGYLSFALNYAVGGTDAVGYHLTNLAIHLANALLVYFLVRLTLRVSGFGFQVSSPSTLHPKPETLNFIPLLAALLFVAHPVQTEAVTYVVQRLASLATLFYLGSLLLYIEARESLGAGGRTTRGVISYGGAVCCALLAMKTKEIAITLPLAVTLYEFMFYSGRPARRFLRLVPLLLTMIVIPATLLAGRGGGASAVQLGEIARGTDLLSRGDYFVTEMRVIVTYVRLLFLPVNQNLVYDYPVFHTLLAPQVLLSLLFLLALIGLAGWQTRNSKLETQNSPLFRVIAFGIFWFFLTLSVESSVIPIADVIFEHRLYLPSVGAFTALAASLALAAERLAARVRGGEKAVVFLAALIVLALAGATYGRNEVWRSQESLWRDVVNKSPGKSFGYQGLGIALAEQGDTAAAFDHFDRAIALDPGSTETYINRGTLYAQTGRYDKAVRDFTRATDTDPSSVEAWNNLGLAFSETGDQEAAIRSLSRAIALDPEYAQAHNNLGLALTRKRLPVEAIGHYDRAIALNPAYGRAYVNRGFAYRAVGRPDRAAADFRTACELKVEEGCRELQSPSN